MSYTVRKIRGRNPWLVKPHAGRDRVIVGVMIHATRGGSTDPNYDDLVGTENWAMHPSNGSAAQGWGSYWDEVIGRRTGERVISTNWDTEYASWTAGFGGAGTWAAGIPYIQIEVCQSHPSQPYTDVQIDSLAQSVAGKSKRYGFPITRIPFLAQTGTPPPGICTHEDSANGLRTGKSDPGPLFPWDTFLRKARAYAGGDEVTKEEFEALKKRVDDIHGALVRDIWTTPERRAELVANGNASIETRLNNSESNEGPIGKRLTKLESGLAEHRNAPHVGDGLVTRDELMDAAEKSHDRYISTLNGETE